MFFFLGYNRIEPIHLSNTTTHVKCFTFNKLPVTGKDHAMANLTCSLNVGVGCLFLWHVFDFVLCYLWLHFICSLSFRWHKSSKISLHHIFCWFGNDVGSINAKSMRMSKMFGCLANERFFCSCDGFASFALFFLRFSFFVG